MVVAIIQARMGAKRLPGKVLKKINGIPLLALEVGRVRLAKKVDKVVVATSDQPQDEVICDFCQENQIDCFRGSESDVLSRYYDCAKKCEASLIVRLTADCPLVDPVIIDKTVQLCLDERVDFSANTVPPDKSFFPDGSDVEVFTMAALARAHAECKNPHDREHVTFYFWKYANGFKTARLENDKDYSRYRFTVDYPQDLEVMELVIEELKKQGRFGYVSEVAAILEANPQIREKNSQYYFGIGWKQ